MNMSRLKTKVVFTVLFLLISIPAFAEVTEIMECKGSSPYQRYDVSANCDTFTNSFSKTIYLYEVKIDPQLFSYNRGDAVEVTGRYTSIGPYSSKKLATNYKVGNSAFGINVYYVAITGGGEQHWFGSKKVCINLNLEKDHINPALGEDYYTGDKLDRCDQDDLQLAIKGPFTFTNTNKREFKQYIRGGGGSGNKGPSRAEKFRQRQIEKMKEITAREEKIQACKRVQNQLAKDISTIDYDTIERDVKLCSKKLAQALEEAQLSDEKLDLLVSEFRESLREDHAPEVRERISLLKVEDVESSRKDLGLNHLYLSNSYGYFDSSTFGFYTTVANSYVDDFLREFVNLRDEASFRVSELSFSETFEFYPSDFKENTDSQSKLDYIDGVTKVVSYLGTIGSISSVDGYGYPLDSPVPAQIRETVRNDIIGTPKFTSVGVELEETLQKLEGQLTEKQKKAFVVIQAFAYLISSAYEDAFKMSATINNALRGVAKLIAGTLCESTALTPVINDGRDAYEALSGVDACTGEVLSWTGRLISAAGVFVGNGAALRKLVGSGVPVSKIDDLGTDLKNLEDLSKVGKWEIKGLLHVFRGEYTTRFRLQSGMHTLKALEHLIKMNQKAGRRLKIDNVANLKDFSLDATNSKILKQTMDNGVIRVQLPREAFDGNRWNKAITEKIQELGDRRLKSVKTLWPETYTPNKVMEVAEGIKNQGNSYQIALSNAVKQGKKGFQLFGKTNEGIRVALAFEKNEYGKYILKTAYPAWLQ